MTKTLSSFKNTCLLALLVFVLSVLNSPSYSQGTKNISRVAIAISNNFTNIWISDFPKNATVMLVDSENNLLAITSTNDYGAAYTTLNKSVALVITAKTINGEVSVTNKSAKQNADGESIAANNAVISKA